MPFPVKPSPFEKSPADKDKPGAVEGSPMEMMADKRQAAATHPKKPNPHFTPFGTKPGATPA